MNPVKHYPLCEVGWGQQEKNAIVTTDKKKDNTKTNIGCARKTKLKAQSNQEETRVVEVNIVVVITITVGAIITFLKYVYTVERLVIW